MIKRRKGYKKSVKTVILASVVMMAVLITSCIFYKGTAVTEELKSEILEDYLLWSGIQGGKMPGEIDCEFFGRYGDSVAVYFHTSGAYETPIEEEIAGYKFSYPDSRVIRIWNKGKFYKMSEAYEKWFISKENVEWIYANYINMSFTEPVFIYQPKEYVEINPLFFTHSYLYLFDTLKITLDTHISSKDSLPPIEFFGTDIVSFIEEDVSYDVYQDETYNQVLRLRLHTNTQEGLLKVKDILESKDGIIKVEVTSGGYRVDGLPDDPAYTDGSLWGLEHIEIDKVWSFTTGS